MYRRNIVCIRYISVNTLLKGDTSTTTTTTTANNNNEQNMVVSLLPYPTKRRPRLRNLPHLPWRFRTAYQSTQGRI